MAEIRWWLELSDIVRNLGILAGGAFGLYLAWKRVVAANQQAEAAFRQSQIALRQSELARREHVAELFNRAVGQLGDPKLEIRLGAVYTLREISRDFPDLTSAVFDLLNVYVRENSNTGAAREPADIEAILVLLKEKLGGT